jgi:hypothetical protein
MKYLNENKLELYKFSKMHSSWKKPENYENIDTSKIDKNIPEVLEIMAKHRIGILDINEYGYFKGNISNKVNWGIYPSEVNKHEYRFELGRIITKESVLINWYIDENLTDPDKIKEEVGEKNHKEFMEDMEKIGEIEEVDSRLEFSVFSKYKIRLNDPYAQSYLLTLGLSYLKDLILNYKAVLMDIFDYHQASSDMYSFKKLLKYKKEIINNNNLEFFPEVEYRLYKDSKFFYSLKKEFFNGDTDDMLHFFKQLYSIN